MFRFKETLLAFINGLLMELGKFEAVLLIERQEWNAQNEVGGNGNSEVNIWRVQENTFLITFVHIIRRKITSTLH